MVGLLGDLSDRSSGRIASDIGADKNAGASGGQPPHRYQLALRRLGSILSGSASLSAGASSISGSAPNRTGGLYSSTDRAVRGYAPSSLALHPPV